MITLKTLHNATAQEVFDQVKNHLLTQKQKSVLEDASNNCQYNNNCQYKSPEGLKCAAGCLIADNEYDVRFEGWKWKGLVRSGFIKISNHSDLIEGLQHIHDCMNVDDWEFGLKEIAKRYNIIYR